ncbi:hypothetical protein TNCV_4926161 [Trichonephila clavipes]|nr:hypothetical protein TNCV_4926161 [Trichonephila clavipes]
MVGFQWLWIIGSYLEIGKERSDSCLRHVSVRSQLLAPHTNSCVQASVLGAPFRKPDRNDPSRDRHGPIPTSLPTRNSTAIHLQTKRECVELIDRYTSSIEFIKASIRHLQGNKPSDPQNNCHLDHIYNEHEQRLSDYTRLLDLTVIKNTSTKRKETEIGFVSPPPHTRKISKNTKTSENPVTNFSIDLTNRFEGLETQEPIATPRSGNLDRQRLGNELE